MYIKTSFERRLQLFKITFNLSIFQKFQVLLNYYYF